jgi:hypothetical protein
VYLISKPLLLPPGNEITLQERPAYRGQGLSGERFSDRIRPKRKKGSFANEDLYLDNIVFDSSHREGGLKLDNFNRAVVSNVSFKHFKTIGLRLGSESHEAIVDTVFFNEYTWDEWTAEKGKNPVRYGTAMSVDAPDSLFLQSRCGHCQKRDRDQRPVQPA